MKNKLQTLLKHKLQWLLLLAALLGVSQDVWGRKFVSGDIIYLTNQSFGNTTWVSNDAWIHMWGGDAGDKDYQFTCVSGTAGEVGAIYAAEIKTAGEYANYIVTRNNSSSSGPWDKKWNQTGNCTLPSSGNRITNIQSDCASITWDTYTPCATIGGTAKANNSTTATISRGASVTLSLTGQTSGSTVVWQKSTDGGSSWSNVGSNTDTPTQNTQYRAEVTNGCPAYSSIAKVQLPTVINVDVSSVNWSTVKIHYWWGDSKTNNGWPGENMSAVSGATGWYTFTIAAERDLRGYIINNNGNNDNQTVDIDDVVVGGINCIKVNTSTVSSSDKRHYVSSADCPATCDTPASQTINASSSSICSGSSVTISTAASENGVTYKLYIGSTLKSTRASTSTSGVTFDAVTLSSSGTTTFTVKALTTGTSCEETVVGTKDVTVNANPSKPTIKSYTASVCSGGAPTFTVASSTGLTYQMYTGGSESGSWVAGEDSKDKTLTAAAITSNKSYVMRATNGNDCYAESDAASVSVTPDASITSVTLTSSPVCIGQGLSATADVELGGGKGAWSSTDESVATITSAGFITPKAAGTTDITYTITGGCGGTVHEEATLTVNPNATNLQYTLTNNAQTYNGSACAVTVTPASGAGDATVYYTGTGSTSYAKTNTAPTNAGSYSISIDAANGDDYCAATNLSLGSDTIKKATQETLTISNTATDLVYCDGANVKLTTSGGSGDGAVTYTVTSGSGSVDGDVLSPSAKGSVSVVADKAASTNYRGIKSDPKTFNFNKTAPTVYTLSNVGGATTICGDPSSGAGSGTLRLADSQTGYKYQLYSNGAPIEGYAAKAGTTGSSIDFPVTSSGTYTVYAYYGDNSTNCPTRMDGEITLTISTQPRLVRSAASVTQYMPVTITSVSTDIAEWKITDDTGTPDLSSSTAYLYDKTYDAISFKGASTNGSTAKTYTIQATTAGGCSATTTITVNPDTESCGG